MRRAFEQLKGWVRKEKMTLSRGQMRETLAVSHSAASHGGGRASTNRAMIFVVTSPMPARTRMRRDPIIELSVRR